MLIREYLARWILGKAFFNSDASREIDRLQAENEKLAERVRELEARQ